MTDYPKALAAARDALDNHDYGHEIPAYVVRNLLAALDAARGGAVASVQTITSLAGETRKCIVGALEVIDSLPVNTAVYAAPPNSPRVERYGEGVLVHWPEGVEQYVAVGDCVTAPPAAMVVQSPSYDALLIIAQSVQGALLRAGVEECDDPGEAIDVMRERYERRIADLAQQPAAAVPAANVTPMRQPRADLARLVESINAAVYANGDGLSVTEAIGALELAKLELLKEQEQ